jgi:hypothetical protein
VVLERADLLSAQVARHREEGVLVLFPEVFDRLGLATVLFPASFQVEVAVHIFSSSFDTPFSTLINSAQVVKFLTAL